MKLRAITRALGLVCLFAGLTLTASAQDADSPNKPDAQKQKDPHKVEHDYLNQRAYGGKIAPDAYDKALEAWRKLPRSSPKKSGGSQGLGTLSGGTSLSGTVWHPIGPMPLKQGTTLVNGRAHAIAINPNNPNVVYEGASGGGVWKSTNAGATWVPLFDQQVSLGIGQPSAIAIDPNNTDTLYVGTSSAFQFFPVTPALTKGILKSTDGGGSWIVLGSGFPAGNTGNAPIRFNGHNVSALIVDPADSTVLYAGSDDGLYRSTDSGQNWTRGTNGTGNCESLVLDASSPSGSRVLFGGVTGSGIRRSNDGGQTWTQILTSATPAVATPLATLVVPAGGSGPFLGKVVVALAPPLSPANPAGVQVVYATIEGSTNDSAGNPSADVAFIFESTDQGGTWANRPATGLGACQCFFSNVIGVDPASPGDGTNDILYWGGTTLSRSTNSGGTFSDVSNGQHVDHHAVMAFVRRPSLPSLVYTGNDGGVFRSADDGATWTGAGAGPATINAGGLQTTMIYDLDIRKDGTASTTLASLQDNGTAKTTGTLQWQDNTGGDGFFISYDGVNVDDAYAITGCGDAVQKTTNNGDSFANITGTIPGSELGCSILQVNTDPSNAGFVYVGGSASQLFQSRDGGGTWRTIVTLGGGILNVNVAPANANNVAAVRGGQVWLSTNALAATVGLPTGVTFQNITRNLPGGFVTRVQFDPNDPTVLYATLSGFGPGHVFKTTIGSANWTNISPPVDVPFNSLALDASSPTGLYAGTDLGVMRSLDGGASWTVLDDIHLPNVPVTDLKINAAAGVMRASTYGRGAFEFGAPTGPVISFNAQNGLSFGNVCAGTTASLTLQVFNTGITDLLVTSVQRIFGSSGFTVLPNPSTPVLISPNSEVDFTIQFTPTVASGTESAQIRVASSDPAAPVFDLFATATVAAPAIDTQIANSGSFGSVCVGSFKDLDLTIANSGNCNLIVSNISSSSLDFLTPGTLSYPITIAPGTSLRVPIRFQPLSPGAKTGTITITSNDPARPSASVAVSGNAPTGTVRVSGSTVFGDVCAGTVAEKTISVCNVGACNLHVISASVSCPDFTIENNPFPAVVSHDFCVPLVIRFTPTSGGPKSCTLTITTDDPVTPIITLTLTANTPAPSIDVPVSLVFPPTVIQSVGACASEDPYPVSNKGICNLTITDISVAPAAGAFINGGDYGFSGLPSTPIILQAGHIAGEGDLNAVFKPTALDRDRLAQLQVVYVTDPITGATVTVDTPVCGEAVLTGARVLVTASGIPLATVDKIMLQRTTGNRNRKIVDTVDSSMNLPLTTVTPTAPCVPFQYHREYGTVSNPIELLPGAYTVTVHATVGKKKLSKTVAFDVTACTFNPNIVVTF